jgi:hypothetical protein
VDQAVGDVGHPQLPLGGLPEHGEDLELGVAEAALVAQLLVDGVLEQAADLHQGERPTSIPR